MVLQRLYCKQVRGQLGGMELKEKKKKEKGGKLHSDGLLRVLTNVQFHKEVNEHHNALAAAEAAKAARQQAQEERDAALKIWKKGEEERKKRNEERYNAWRAAEAQWEEDKKAVKMSKGKLKDWTKEHPKPKRNDAAYKNEPAAPKPKVTDIINEVLEGIVEEEDEGSEGSNDED
ncbi:hypothetical protein H0H87_011690 [Tephrocybe sp. NHM501043]|nr:hypothetical protein H0H87_011690 [Tephrocybe sp. NHM501043]